MKKQIALGLAVLGTAVAVLPLFAAFEAHVINVTARIENALNVPIKYLDYGTVFPQEYLLKDVPVRLSGSFMNEDRVDDVEYFIRQKPKCAITWNNGTEYDNTVGNDGRHTSTGTGHVVPNLETTDPTDYTIDCGKEPRELKDGETWGPLPMLCPYLSKHERTEDGVEIENDSSMPAFHMPFWVDASGVHWTEVDGRLTKGGGDIDDNWIIDLAVPCFGGYCAQDWAHFVGTKNPDEKKNASSWTQPIKNEHKIFGCDLWLEVSKVSQAPYVPPTTQ